MDCHRIVLPLSSQDCFDAEIGWQTVSSGRKRHSVKVEHSQTETELRIQWLPEYIKKTIFDSITLQKFEVKNPRFPWCHPDGGKTKFSFPEHKFIVDKNSPHQSPLVSPSAVI